MEKSTSDTFAKRCKYGVNALFSYFVGGIKLITAAPGKWKLPEWSVVAAFFAALVFLYLFKWPVQNFFGGDGLGWIDEIADIGRDFGDFELPLGIGLLLLFVGCLKNRSKWMESGAALLAAAAMAGVVVLLGQFVLAEQRPRDGGAMMFFNIEGHGISGHATSSALILWPIRNILLKDRSEAVRTMVSVLLISWAFMVAWSRMWHGRHFMWNVLFGLAIGFSAGYAAVKSRELNPGK